MSESPVAGGSTPSSESREPLSQAVVEAVARAEDVDPLDLDVPLYEAVDPDALDALFQSGETGVEGHVRFRYYGYEVAVGAGGHVSLDPVDDR